MIDSRDPAASCGVTLAGTTKILTSDLSRQKNAEVHRKYLSAAALADPKVGPVFCCLGQCHHPDHAIFGYRVGHACSRPPILRRSDGEQPQGYLLPLQR